MKRQIFLIANKFYQHCYPLYYLLYSNWKPIADRHERQVVERCARPGMRIADVGANIGMYTKFFSEVAGNTGRVHAFEPAPSNFRRLRQHTGGLANVSLNQAAVGEASGTIDLYISKDLNVDHRTFDGGDGREKISVPVLRLDDYFPAGERVDLIKIDVQGYELSVLRGAQRVLDENRGIKLLVEFWPYGLRKAATDPSDILKFARSHGFSVTPINKPAELAIESASQVADNDAVYCNILLSRT